MAEIYRKKWGDRRDARMVRGGHGLQTVMAHLMPNRTDNEVYLNYKVDATRLLEYLEQKNSGDPEVRTTIFHCILMGVARIIKERPLMNRFVQGHRIYERDEISLSFVAKRRFNDGGDEALMFLVPDDDCTVDDIARRVSGDVNEVRKHEHAEDGLDEFMDSLVKVPRLAVMGFIKGVKILDFWGKNAKSLTDGDPNYSTVMLSNLGSIKCPAVYHHLNNYGTLSIVITIGVVHKEPMVMDDGSIEARDVIEIGATLDERIADGFYFARSLKLIDHIFQHPELLEQPLNIPSGFDYE